MRVPVLMIVLAAMAGGQSLWNPERRAPSLFSDTTARGIGDVLTVVIEESQRITNQERSEFTKEMDLNAALTDFQIIPKAFNPLPSVSGSSDREMRSDARYDKQGNLQTRISVVVIDTLPNGNMVIEGRRRVVIDREIKTMRLTGVVRPWDVTPLNTISSWQIANASIAYEGNGPLTNITNRGWLSQLLDYVWPF